MVGYTGVGNYRVQWVILELVAMQCGGILELVAIQYSGMYWSCQLYSVFYIHGTVHRSMTSSNNQQDAT